MSNQSLPFNVVFSVVSDAYMPERLSLLNMLERCNLPCTFIVIICMMQVLRMEQLVLKVLKFDLGCVTVKDFMDRFLKVCTHW